MSVVDCHAHFIPRSVVRSLEAGTVPGVGVDDQHAAGIRFHFPDLDPSPPAPPRIHDADAAVSWMDDRGIDRQLLSPWTDLLGYTLDERVARQWTQRMNESLLETATASDRLDALATVPLQWPDLAATELARAHELGCRGVMIGTSAPDTELDDRRLDVLWQAASELQMPVVVHPIFLGLEPRLRGHGLANAVGRANETAIAIARLLLGGVLQRHPDLVVIVVHGGAGLPVLLPRLHRNHTTFAPDTADPRIGFARLYFDSVVLDPRVLRDLLEVTTADRVVLGSDYPFPWEPDPRRVVEQAELGAEATRMILGDNAERLFGPADDPLDNAPLAEREATS